MNHYGFYHSDNHFGNEHKPYRDWVLKKGHDIGVKKRDDYHSECLDNRYRNDCWLG